MASAPDPDYSGEILTDVRRQISPAQYPGVPDSIDGG